jgi:hypothetical protein
MRLGVVLHELEPRSPQERLEPVALQEVGRGDLRRGGEIHLAVIIAMETADIQMIETAHFFSGRVHIFWTRESTVPFS